MTYVSPMENYDTINRWIVDAFRCATITKDDKLEREVLFINMAKQELYNKR